MNFKKWLEASGGSGGIGSGIHPVKQNPLSYQGAFPIYHNKNNTDPSNQNGKLPPLRTRDEKTKNPTTYLGKKIKKLS